MRGETMKRVKLFIAIIVLLVAPAVIYGDFGQVFSYQGKLTDGTGLPAEAPVNMIFRLWTASTAGTEIWSISVPGVDPVHGIFSVNLNIADGAPGTIDWDSYGEIWLEIEVDGVTLTPRELLTSAFHAFNVADGSVTQTKLKSAGTGTSSHLLSSDGAGGFIWTEPADVGTDNQSLSFSGTASPYTLEITDGDNVTFTEGTGITLTRTSGTNLTITNAGDNDNSSTNELITEASFASGSNTLTISDAGTDWNIDLSALDNTGSDIQNLTVTNTGGVTIDLSGTDSDILVSGSGATTVSRTGTNEITISSTDNNTTYSAGDGIVLTGTAFSADFAGTGTATTVAHSDHDHESDYDNYLSWNLQAEGGATVGIISGSDVNFTGTGGAVVSRDGNTIEIDASGVSTPPGGNDGNVQYKAGTAFAGSDNLHWDAINSRLGIGTTSPSDVLNIRGGGNLLIDGTGSGLINLGHGIRAANRAELHLHSNGADAVSEVMFGFDARNDDNVRWVISDRGQTDGILHFYEGPALTGSSFSPRMTLASGGNVGIGLTTPTRPLDVNGAGRIRGDLGVDNNLGVTGQTSTGTFLMATGASNGHVLTSDASGYGTWQAPPSLPSNNVTGSGTENYVARFTSTGSVIGNSSIFDNGNVGIGTATPGADLDVAGRTVKLSNLYPEYRWYWGGAEDLAWKKIADISLSSGSYRAVSFEVEIQNAGSNFGSSISALPLRYFVSANRSSGTADSPNSGYVSGPFADYVRLVKTSTGVYELQVRQTSSWRHMTVKARVNSQLGATVSYLDTPVNGSTTGDIYTASATHYDYLTNLYVRGDIGIGTTSPSAQLHTTGSLLFSGAGTPALGKVLTSDASGNATWQDPPSLPSNNVTGSGTATRVAFWDGENTITSNANLYWDNTNNRLGIGTASPNDKLTVADGNMIIYNDGLNVNNFAAYLHQDFNDGSLPSDFSLDQITATYPEPSLIRLTSTGVDPKLYWRSLFIDGGVYRYIVFKLRWVSGSTSWQGTTYYSISSGHGSSESYRQRYTIDVTGNWKIYVLDMWSLDAGGSDWKDNTITEIRNDWSSASGGVFELDWIAIGSDGPSPLVNIFEKSGNVGIGTTSPTQLLDVNGQIRIRGGSPGAGKILQSDANGVASWETPPSVPSNNVTGSGTENYVAKFTSTGSVIGNSSIYDDGTNVGIGTASPNENFEIYKAHTGGPTSALRLQQSNNTVGAGLAIDMKTSTNNLADRYVARIAGLRSSTDNGSSDMAFYTDNVSGDLLSERMRILYNGNVGIGTSAPAAKLDVEGGIAAYEDEGSFIYLRPGASSSTVFYNGSLDFNQASSYSGLGSASRVIIDSDGNVGIGNESPAYKLDVDGDIAITGGLHDGASFGSADQVLTADGSGGISWQDATGGGISDGTVNNSTLRWNATGSSWNENTTVQTQPNRIDIRSDGADAFLYVGDETGGTDPRHVVIRAKSASGASTYMTSTNDFAINTGGGLGLNPAANREISIKHGGTEYARFDGANQRLGIGTTAPAADIDVGGTTASGALRNVFARQSEGNSTGSGTFLGVRAWGTQASAYNGKMFSIENTFYGQLNSSIEFYRGGSTTGGYTTFTTDNGTERMRIATNGNVGIGTTSPYHKLHVNGNMGISASGYLNFGNTTGSGGYGIRDNSGNIEYKHSSGSWMVFPAPPPSGTPENWYRPASASYIQPVSNNYIRIYDSGQTYGVYYDGSTNQYGGYFRTTGSHSPTSAVVGYSDVSGNNTYGYLGYNGTWSPPTSGFGPISGAAVYGVVDDPDRIAGLFRTTGSATYAANIGYSDVWIPGYFYADHIDLTYNSRPALYGQMNVHVDQVGFQPAVKGYAEYLGGTTANSGITAGGDFIAIGNEQDAFGIYAYAESEGTAFAAYLDGNVHITGDLTIDGSYPGGSGSSLWNDATSYIYPNDASNFTIYDNTSSYTGLLYVGSTNTSAITNWNNGGVTVRHVYNSSGTTYGTYATGGNYGIYAQGSTYAGYFMGNIYASGNVGIGNTSPGAKLDVWGTTKLANASGNQHTWFPYTDGYNYITADITYFRNATYTNYGAWTSTGLGIGTTSPGQKLDITGGNARATGEFIGTLGSGYGQFRAIHGNYGTFIRNDGSNTYILLTNSGDPYGGWNGLRPFMISNSTGDVYMHSGNAFYARASDGNIGIRTTSPTSPLFVYGNQAAGNPSVYITARNDNWAIAATNESGFGGGGGYFSAPSGYWGLLCAGGSKNAVVRTSEGPTALFCMESPEVWFEDIGGGKLIDGKAHIEIDPLFLETVTIDDENPMRVFIQPNGESNGLIVIKGKTGFDVIEQNSGTSNIAFDYRILAKRKYFETDRLTVWPNPTHEHNPVEQEDIDYISDQLRSGMGNIDK